MPVIKLRIVLYCETKKINMRKAQMTEVTVQQEQADVKSMSYSNESVLMSAVSLLIVI